MEILIEFLGKLINAKMKDVKKDIREEVHEASNVLENHVRRGILDALDIATKPLIYIAMATSVIAASALFLLYGVAQMLESVSSFTGSGYLIVGLTSLVTCYSIANKASNMLKKGFEKSRNN